MDFSFSKKIFFTNSFFGFLILVFCFQKIVCDYYTDIITQLFIKKLKPGSNIRFCKDCICIDPELGMNGNNHIICLIKGTLYILSQNNNITFNDDL